MMTSTSDSCKEASKLDDVCEVNDKLKNMSTADKEDVSICANCGKEGNSDNMNTCNKCKQVKYCNAVCKKVHKKKHKIDCEEHVRLATEKHNEELRIAAELHDKELFKQPPPLYGDCPICFLCLPTLQTGSRYKLCCGKTICCGCAHAPVYDNQGNKVAKKTCPFCRVPPPSTDEELNDRREKRIEAEDPIAIYNLGCFYRIGKNGYPQDYNKALELFHRSTEMDYSEAYTSIGNAYNNGEGVEVDKKKAIHYWGLAAMGGDEMARHNLGITEKQAGNYDRALKHLMISVRGGYNESLDSIKKMFSKGHATKDDYTKALQIYQVYLSEIKSAQRDEAAAAHDCYKYY